MAINKAVTNLFILSPPKTGSTSLFFDLIQHPQILGCSVKEPHFFLENDITQDKIESYNKLFNGSNKYRLEASTNYLHNDIAIANIKQFCLDDLKFIIILRNPVDRLISEYIHKRSIFLILQNEEVHQKFRSEMDWVESWDKQINTKSGRGEKRNLELIIKNHKENNKYAHYFEIGNYYAHINRLYDNFDKNNIEIILYDTFKDNNQYVLSSICKFLDISNFDFEFKDVNKADYWLKYVQCKEEIEPSHIEYIKNFYAESNTKLANLLNIELDWNR
jgi:hypothetical protein